jgi:hypothetical protein
MSAPLPDWCMPIFPIADAYHEHLGRQYKENLMASQAMSEAFLNEIRTEQAWKDADLATRIIEAFAGKAVSDPRERAVYNSAMQTMTMYLTYGVEVKK